MTSDDDDNSIYSKVLLVLFTLIMKQDVFS